VAERHSKAALTRMEEIRRFHRTPKPKKKSGKKKKGGPNNNKHAPTTPETNGGNDDTTTEAAYQPKPDMVSDVEMLLCQAIRVLTAYPGVDADLAADTVGRPFADAMRKVFQKYTSDPEVTYCFAEALMVMNAWQLYDYPSGEPVSPDVLETKAVLEKALALHPKHAGLCHMYVPATRACQQRLFL
jgi:hypothetical protein